MRSDVEMLLASAEPMEVQAVADAAGNVERPWPTLDPAALYGLPGRIVRAIEPHSEADPVAILMQTLAAGGSMVGRGPHTVVEADRHGCNEFVVLVGNTSSGRKGTSWGRVRRLHVAADPDRPAEVDLLGAIAAAETLDPPPSRGPWENRIQSGLSSGEGLIWAVRDPIISREPVKVKGRVVEYELVERDAGVPDKRLLVVESEFARALRVASRDGNTLSAVLRLAWETGILRTMTKHSPANSTDAHICIIGHITREELLRHMAELEAANGYGNRHLWAMVKRSKLLPEGGGDLPPQIEAGLLDEIRATVQWAHDLGDRRIDRDDAARALWRSVYPELSAERPGIYGAMTARGPAHVLRLSLLYAVLDRSETIRVEHLQAALAVWRYCDESVRYIWGEALGDPIGDELLAALRRRPEGMTRDQTRDLFGRHASAARLNAAVEALVRAGRIEVTERATGGRTATHYRVTGGRP